MEAREPLMFICEDFPNDYMKIWLGDNNIEFGISEDLVSCEMTMSLADIDILIAELQNWRNSNEMV